MIDPATGWFEIASISRKRADYVANYLEMTWLTRYPWPTEIVLDRGSEFKLEVQDILKDECGINKKLITTRNPQVNSMVERVHQTVHNMLKVSQMDNSGASCSQFYSPHHASRNAYTACVWPRRTPKHLLSS